MNIREISKPVTAKALNESLAKRFGQRIAIDSYTLEQLQDARNKLRTQLSQVETTESYNAVNGETYQKSKLFLDVLNAAVLEREDVSEAKPDFLDLDKDGDKKEPMKKAAADKKKKTVKEGAEEAAELVMAAKDMVDRVTGWMEDTAEMQSESMLELADSIRDEMGTEQSEAFTNSVKPALEALYTALEATREALTGGVGLLTGEGAPLAAMGDEEVPVEDPAMEPTVDAEVPAEDDGMAAAEPAAGGAEEAGRAKRESIERSRKVGSLLSSKKKVSEAGEQPNQTLILVLRNLLANANLKKVPSELSFDQLNKLMLHVGREQFDYRTFKASYDSDERVKKMIKNFDQNGLTLKTDTDADTQAPQQDTDTDKVSQMAKRATRARQ